MGSEGIGKRGRTSGRKVEGGAVVEDGRGEQVGEGKE